MAEAVMVEIVGGPHCGQTWAITGDQARLGYIEVVLPAELNLINRSELDVHAPTFRTVRCDLVQREHQAEGGSWWSIAALWPRGAS